MSHVSAVSNQKGGVAKTTTSVNLAAALQQMGKRVLLVDMDPQGNATMGSGVDKFQLGFSMYELLAQRCPPEQVLIAQTPAGYDLLGANSDLTALEVELVGRQQANTRLRTCLQSLQTDYDFIIIDCPPALNMLTLNALAAADGVIIPVQCEYYALEGLSELMRTISGVSADINPKLHIEGIVRTMVDYRNTLTNDISEQLIEYFGDKVFNVVINRNVRLAEAPSHGLPVLLYDPKCAGAVNHLALAGEYIRRFEVNYEQ